MKLESIYPHNVFYFFFLTRIQLKFFFKFSKIKKNILNKSDDLFTLIENFNSMGGRLEEKV